MAAVKNKKIGNGGYRNSCDFVEVEYDFAKDGGTVGSKDLFEASSACIVHLEHFHVKTALLGTGLRLEVGKTGTGEFAEVAVANLTLNSMHCPKTLTTAYERTSVTCVADVTGSLNNKYFLLNTPAGGTAYYVWMNVNAAGADPAVAGRTGIEVALATDDADTVVATKVRAVLEAHSAFTAGAPVGAVILVDNVVYGPVLDGAAGNSGFTVSTSTQGSYNGFKGILLAAGEKITMAIRDTAATAGKINFVLKLLSI